VFGLGHAPELILVLVLALIVLGPGKIPEVAQFLGKAIRELRQASADLQKTFDVNELVNPPPPPPTPPPVEAAPAPLMASTETILPPAPEPPLTATAVQTPTSENAAAETPAKPKRTRRKPASASNGSQPEAAATLLGTSTADMDLRAAHPNGPQAGVTPGQALASSVASDVEPVAAHPTGWQAGVAAGQPLTGSSAADVDLAAGRPSGAEPANGSEMARTRTRRRPSKKTAEAVSLDATA